MTCEKTCTVRSDGSVIPLPETKSLNNDDIGATVPEVYCFAGQTPEEVKAKAGISDTPKPPPNPLTPEGAAELNAAAARVNEAIGQDAEVKRAEAILDKEKPGWRDEAQEKADILLEAKQQEFRDERKKKSEEDLKQIKDFLGKAGKLEVEDKNPDGKLSYDNENSAFHQPDLRAHRGRFGSVDNGACDILPEWRALAGLCPKEDIVEHEPVVLEVMESIVVLIGQRCPSLNAEWGGSCWNKHLLLNGGKTAVSSVSLKHAFDALKAIATEMEAAKAVTELVVNRVTALFSAC